MIVVVAAETCPGGGRHDELRAFSVPFSVVLRVKTWLWSKPLRSMRFPWPTPRNVQAGPGKRYRGGHCSRTVMNSGSEATWNPRYIDFRQ